VERCTPICSTPIFQVPSLQFCMSLALVIIYCQCRSVVGKLITLHKLLFF
jgi:hypothetical protein